MGDEIPAAIDRAARYGCHLTGPRDANMLGPYERALRKYGRDPGQYFRNVYTELLCRGDQRAGVEGLRPSRAGADARLSAQVH